MPLTSLIHPHCACCPPAHAALPLITGAISVSKVMVILITVPACGKPSAYRYFRVRQMSEMWTLHRHLTYQTLFWWFHSWFHHTLTLKITGTPPPLYTLVTVSRLHHQPWFLGSIVILEWLTWDNRELLWLGDILNLLFLCSLKVINVR